MIERSQVRGATREKLSPGSAFCADYAAVSIPPHVTTVACKKNSSSAKSVVDRLQLNSHASYVFGFEKQSCKLVHDCMVCTELALRQQQLHVAPAMEQLLSTVTISMAIQNAVCKATATHSESPTTTAIAAHSVAESGSAQNCEALWVHPEMRLSTSVPVSGKVIKSSDHLGVQLPGHLAM